MTETDEDWAQLAMGDACLVADLLLRILRQPRPSWINWTVRARRSRKKTRNSDGVTRREATDAKPEMEQARASPSTPLSWSGATTTSGGASEWSPSLVDHRYAARSKAPLATVAPTTTAALTVTAGKRPRQKKRSLFELREEESLLLKERRCLEQDLASLRIRVEKERSINESLKRLNANTSVFEKEKHSTPQSCLQQRDSGYFEVTPEEPHGGGCYSGRNMVETIQKALLPDLNLPLDEEGS